MECGFFGVSFTSDKGTSTALITFFLPRLKYFEAYFFPSKEIFFVRRELHARN